MRSEENEIVIMLVRKSLQIEIRTLVVAVVYVQEYCICIKLYDCVSVSGVELIPPLCVS